MLRVDGPGLGQRRWVPFSGHRDTFTGVTRSGREVNHSSPFRSEVKNEEIYTSTPLICLHGVGSEKFISY